MTWKEHFSANMKLALPVMAAQLGQITVNIADSVMVGQLDDETGLAAVSLGNAVFITLLVFLFGFSMAISPLIAQADAKNDFESGGETLKTGVFINLALVFIIYSLVSGNIGLLHQMNQPKDVVELAIPYLNWMMFSLFPIILFTGLRQFAEGISEVLIVFFATLFANLLNVVLNYGLIYGNLGMPALGVEGAAVGSFISRVAMLLLMAFFLLRNERAKEYIKHISARFPKWSRIKKMISLGFPIAMQMLFEVGAFTGAAFISGYGERKIDLAAHQIIFSLIAITFMICSGLGVAATIRVGNQYGLKDYKNLRKAGWSVIIMSTLLMLGFSFVFYFFRHIIPLAFSPESEAVAAMASQLLILAAILQIPDGLQVVSLGALRGQEDVVIPGLISLLAFWGVSIPLGKYLSIDRDMGAEGMWMALVIGLFISAILLLLRFNYRSNQLIKRQE